MCSNVCLSLLFLTDLPSISLFDLLCIKHWANLLYFAFNFKDISIAKTLEPEDEVQRAEVTPNTKLP